MKLLPEVIRRDGYTHTMIIRKGDVAVFDMRHKRSKTPRFEVVKIRKLPACLLRGVAYEAREALPLDKDWGLHGWTYVTIAAAMLHFEILATKKPYDLYHFLPEQRRRARRDGVRR